MSRRLGGGSSRLGGALILALALLAAGILPNLAVRQVVGLPLAQVVPGPPAVGECVLASAEPGAGGAAMSNYSAAVLIYGGCGGPHLGEVVALLRDAGSQPVGDLLADPVEQSCDRAAIAYLGVGDAAGFDETTTDSWFPAFDSGGMAGVPDGTQAAAGQQWLACTVIPRQPTTGRSSSTGRQTPAPGGAVASASTPALHGTFGSGELPAGVGLCSSDGAAASRSQLACDEPHAYQILGEASTDPASSLSALTHSCLDLLKVLTKMPDVTAGGRLEPVITFSTWGAAALLLSPSPMPTSNPQSATCALRVRGAAALTGSLFGLGAGELPLTGS